MWVYKYILCISVYIYVLHVFLAAASLRLHMSLVPSQAAQSGLIAAAVASLFREPVPPFATPCLCEDTHWPSLIAGILLGLCLGQVFEWILVLRAAWSLQLRHQLFWHRNLQVARARLA